MCLYMRVSGSVYMREVGKVVEVGHLHAHPIEDSSAQREDRNVQRDQGRPQEPGGGGLPGTCCLWSSRPSPS